LVSSKRFKSQIRVADLKRRKKRVCQGQIAPENCVGHVLIYASKVIYHRIVSIFDLA
jgi:hypothetical protein